MSGKRKADVVDAAVETKPQKPKASASDSKDSKQDLKRAEGSESWNEVRLVSYFRAWNISEEILKAIEAEKSKEMNFHTDYAGMKRAVSAVLRAERPGNYPFRDRSKLFRQAIAIALDSAIPVIPLHDLIMQYFFFAGGTVVTFAGDGSRGDNNGIGRAAQFSDPSRVAILPSPDGDSLLVADSDNGLVRRVWMKDGRVGQDSNRDRRGGPVSVCANPMKPDEFYVARIASIDLYGNRNGYIRTVQFVLPTPQFSELGGITIAPSVQTLYACDFDANRLYMVDLKTKAVTVGAGNGKEGQTDGIATESCLGGPRDCAFYRSLTASPDSILFITAGEYIRQLNIASGELKTLAVAFKSGPSGIDCTSNGILIISSSGAHCLYACDPIKAEVERIAGTYGHGNFDGDALTIAEFCRPGGICVDQTRQRVWIADSGNHTIRYLTLDPSFFVE